MQNVDFIIFLLTLTNANVVYGSDYSFLVAWLVGLFYFASCNMSIDLQRGFFCGGIVGVVVGGTIGIFHLIQSRRRLNRILKQIEEIKSGE